MPYLYPVVVSFPRTSALNSPPPPRFVYIELRNFPRYSAEHLYRDIGYEPIVVGESRTPTYNGVHPIVNSRNWIRTNLSCVCMDPTTERYGNCTLNVQFRGIKNERYDYLPSSKFIKSAFDFNSLVLLPLSVYSP